MSRLRTRPGRRRAFLPSWLILLAACLPGCRKEPAAPISQQKFVDAYVQLVQARIDAAGDSVAYAAKRDRVFMDTGVKPADLRAFVEAGRRNPLPLRDAWQSIAARLDTLYGGVTSGPPAGLREALRTRGDTTSVSPRVIRPGTPARDTGPPVSRPADSSVGRRGVPGLPPGAPTADSSRARLPDVETRPTLQTPSISEDSIDKTEPPHRDTMPHAPAKAAGDTLPAGTPRDSG
jgi:hypothetical protein